MRFAFVTDIHEVTAHIGAFAQAAGAVDALVVGGDITNFGGPSRAQRVLGALRDHFPTIIGVHGNVDGRKIGGFLQREGIGLHGRAEVVNGVAFVGCGGSNRTPLRTPNEYTEAEIASALEQGLALVEGNERVVVVSHVPPSDMSVDRIHWGKHVGSTALREFLEGNDQRIDLCLCGHIHEGYGTEHLGKVLVCNPGAFMEGRFAVVEISNDGVACELGQIPLGRVTRLRNTLTVDGGKVVGLLRHWLTVRRND